MDVLTFTLGTGDSIPSRRGVPELHEGLHEGLDQEVWEHGGDECFDLVLPVSCGLLGNNGGLF